MVEEKGSLKTISQNLRLNIKNKVLFLFPISPVRSHRARAGEKE